MSGSHRGRRSAPRRGSVRRAWSSVRLRALLSLGVLALPMGMGTLAFWTDSVSVTGAAFTGGTLDMSVSGGDPYASATLAMPLMVPGSTSAEVLTVQNVGNVPLKYSLTGIVTGTDAAAMAPNLTLTIRAGGTRSGSTCINGTQIYSSVLGSVATTDVIAPTAPRGPVVAAVGPTPGTDPLCFQVTFSAGAPTALQGDTATIDLTFLGTTNVA